jgi:hypothetical protein
LNALLSQTVRSKTVSEAIIAAWRFIEICLANKLVDSTPKQLAERTVNGCDPIDDRQLFDRYFKIFTYFSEI